MTLGLNYVIAPKPTQIVVRSQSAANILAIMGGLPRSGGDERHIGINEWVDRVRLALSEDQLHQVTLVTWGLGVEGLLNCVPDVEARESFDTYLAHLDALPAENMRDTCLYWMLHSAHRAVYIDAEPINHPSIDTLLSNREQLIHYLQELTLKEPIYANLEAITDLYFDPDSLKSLTVSVLRNLWQSHFKAEWARHQPEIDRVVDAFAHIDVSGMATFEAIQVITGRDLRGVFRADRLSRFEQLIFVPSKHNGPYVMWFGDNTRLYIVFTARMPSTALLSERDTADLNVLIQRFKALSDDNRMQVLLAIREQGELSTQDIIEQFDLNKSAASRYLGQLLANGFITERRDTDGKTKYYSINPDVIDTFLQAIAQLLKS